jgi:hypothetical protein
MLIESLSILDSLDLTENIAAAPALRSPKTIRQETKKVLKLQTLP